MKIFLGLFLVGSLAYVQAEPHKCDPRAADMKKAEGTDKHNHHIPFETFIEKNKKRLEWYIPYASINNTFGKTDDFKFCTAATFADVCGVIFYHGEITNTSRNKDFRQIFHSYSLNEKTRKLTAYSMEFVLSDPDFDDYIFKSTGVITAYHEDGPQTPLDIPENLEAFLNEELALFYADDKFAVHVLCDKDYAWVSLRDGVKLDDALKQKINEVFNDLANVDDIPFKQQKSMRYLESTTYNKTEWMRKFPRLVMPAA